VQLANICCRSQKFTTHFIFFIQKPNFSRTPSIRKQRFSPLVFNLALCDLISSFYFFVYGTMAILGSVVHKRFLLMPNSTCFHINIPAVFSFNAGCFMIFVLGIDRLMSVCCPFFYKSLNSVYIYGCIWLSWMYGLINFALGKKILSLNSTG